MLRISVLGPVQAHRDAEEIELGGHLQRGVIAVLVAAGPGTLVSADRFVEYLWSGEPPPKALGALHVYVSRLRRALEPERARRQPARVLASVSPGYRLELPVDAVDAWAFESLVESAGRQPDAAEVVALLEAAENLWHGEPFGPYADQEWARAEAERLTELRAGATELLASALLSLGRTVDAVTSLTAQVRRYPLREQAVELLATALYRSGRQGDALAAIARIRRALARELGVDPSPRLRALEADVLAHADRLAERPAARPAPTSRTPEPIRPERLGPQPSFVGRVAELDRLNGWVRAAGDGDRAGVVWISGEAGVGKSALAGRLCDLVVGEAVVARGRCFEVDGAPAGWPWVEVLRSLRRTDHADGISHPVSAFALAAEVVETLADYRERTVLIVLDDLHRADDETLQVLRQVVESVRQPVVVLGTVRGELAGEALGLTAAAVAEHTLGRIDLAGLDDAAAAELLGRFGRRPLSAAATAELVGRSGGNPLFLREIGHLVAAEGADAGLALPPVIRDLLTRRIQRLPAPVLDLLSRAALSGRDVDVDLLVELERARGGMSEDDVLDALDAGLVAGLLDLPAPGDLRFTHALVRDTLYERLPPIRRARLHQDWLGVLERDHPERVDALAHHAAAGLDPRSAGRAAGHLERATQESAAIGAHRDVVRHAREALAALDLLPADPPRVLALLRLLGRGLAASGDVAGARAVRLQAVQLAEAHGSQRDVAEQLTWDTATVWTVRPLAAVDPDLVHRLQVAIESLDGDDPLRVRLLATLALETEASPLTAVAEQAAAEAVAMAERLDDPALLCQALNAAYFVSFEPRPGGLQRDVGERLLGVATQAGLVGYQAAAHHILFGAAAGDGDLETAAAHVAEALRCGDAGQLPLLLAVSALFDGVARLVAGELDAAIAVYTELSRRLEASGDSNGDSMGLILAFTIRHAQGDTSGLHDGLMRFADAAQFRMGDLIVRARLDAGDQAGAAQLWPQVQPVVQDALWAFFTAIHAENAAELGDLDACRAGYQELAPFAGRFAGLSSGSTTVGPVDYILGVTAAALGRADDARRHLLEARELALRHGNRVRAAKASRLIDVQATGKASSGT